MKSPENVRPEDLIASPLYARIADLLQAARQSVAQVVNRTMVYTYRLAA